VRPGARVACITPIILILAACGGDDGNSVSSRDQTNRTTATISDPGTADDYVGLTKQAAIAKADAAGRPWRIGREDDKQFPVTLDFNEERVTFEVDDGTVTQATFG
jgi:hypothetical protein